MGEISQKLINNFKKYKLSKVINLSELLSTKKAILEIDSGLARISRDEDMDPSQKVYTQLQNILSYFLEEVSVLDEFSELYEMIVESDSEYMPSYPPMSPLTVSYFSYCCLCDFRFGKQNETISTIFKDVALHFNYDELFIKAMDNLVGSSMKFYKHLGMKDNLVELTDIMTGDKQLCISTSNYFGKEGQIWFVRMVPNLDEQYDYQIILNTPYVILKQIDEDWVQYFKRQGIKMNEIGIGQKILDVMKYNSDVRYWHNYIMDAYVGYESNCIFLTGIPDIKGSKPLEM